MMNIFLWIVVGLVTGAMARKLMPGPAAGGISIAILIGLVGAIVGGVAGTIFSGNTWGSFNFITVLTAVSGALYPLFLYRCFALRTCTPSPPRRKPSTLSSPVPLSAARLPIRPSDVPGVA